MGRNRLAHFARRPSGRDDDCSAVRQCIEQRVDAADMIQLQEHQRAVAVAAHHELLEQCAQIVNGGLVLAGRSGREEHEARTGRRAQCTVVFVRGAASRRDDVALDPARRQPELYLGDLQEVVEVRSRRARDRHDDVAGIHRREERGHRIGAVLPFDADDAAGHAAIGKDALPARDAVQEVAVAADVGAGGNRRPIRRLLHAIEQPVDHQPAPPRYTTWPVTMWLSGLRKKSTMLTTSAKTAQRRIAWRSTSACTFVSPTPAVSFVLIGHGPMALHVIPNGATSRAAIRVKVSSALFDAAYTASPSRRIGTATVLRLTMRAAGEARIMRMLSRVNWNAARKFVSITRRATSTGVSAIAFMLATPALLMSTSSVLMRAFRSRNSRSTALSSVMSSSQCM